MNCFDPINLFSPFSFGASHVKSGLRSLFEHDASFRSRLNSCCEMILGLSELIPGVGLVPASLERMSKISTVRGLLSQRTLQVQAELLTESFQVQELYYDTFSSETLADRSPLRGVQNALDGSLPDVQYAAFAKKISDYLKENEAKLSADMIDRCKSLLKKLAGAQEIATYLTCIFYAESVQDKQLLIQELKARVKDQLQKLSDGESLIFPAGYVKGSLLDLPRMLDQTVDMHAVLMEVHRVNESYDVVIFNTGEGINTYHSRDEDVDHGIIRAYPAGFMGISLHAGVWTKCPPSWLGLKLSCGWHLV